MARDARFGMPGGGRGVGGSGTATSYARSRAGNPPPNKGGGLKTTTGKPKTKVTNKDAKTASGTMKQRPNEAGRARTTVKPSGTGLSPSEAARVRTRQPITKTKTDPAALRQSIEDRAKARNAQTKINTNTKPPARPKVSNKTPVKRDIDTSRTTFVDGKYRARPVLQDLKSPDRTKPQPTIESRTSQDPRSRGTNVERVMNRPTRSQKEADRRVNEGLKAIAKADKIKALRQKWKKAGPAQRMIIEKQAKLLKNKGNKKTN